MMKLIKTLHNFLKRGTFNYSHYMDSDTKPNTDIKWLLLIGYLNQLPYLKVFFFSLFTSLWIMGITTLVTLRTMYELWNKKEQRKLEGH